MASKAHISGWLEKARGAAAPALSAARRLARVRTIAASGGLVSAIAADAVEGVRYLRQRAPGAMNRVSGWGEAVNRWARRSADALRPAKRPYRIARAFLLVLLIGVGVMAGLLAWALHDLPYASVLEEPQEPTIILEAATGDILAEQGALREADVAREDLPDHLVDAVLSIEDRRFYVHSGIDPVGIVRAMLRNYRAGQVVQGGSTITQQLVKIRYLEQDRSLKRKIREAVLAVWLDSQLNKDEILTRYLNSVYFGAGATGIGAAARIYFDKEVRELTLAESAMLAGLIKAPSQFNPLRNPEAARERTTLVLDAMVDNRRIDEATAEDVKAEPAELNPARIAAPSGTWFADWVRQEAAGIAGSFRGALRVRTTIVPELQALAERIVATKLEEEGRAAGVGQVALVAMRPDGAVLAMVGGRDYEESQYNRAVQAMRQPGSAFKLFVYYAALRNGLELDDRVEDAPIEIGDWQPENFSESYRGPVTLAQAFTQSLNAAAVRLGQEVGIEEVVEAARDLGIEAPLRETPSLALGTSEVSLLDMTEAYAAVRAGVAPIEAWGVAGFGEADREELFGMGPPIAEQRDLQPYQEQLIPLLQGVVEGGTGQRAALDGALAAGKTGTSQNHRDAWFIGFSEELVAGVWVGNDDGTPMDEVTGGRLPAEIWQAFMTEALEILRPSTLAGPIAVAPRPYADETNERHALELHGGVAIDAESDEEEALPMGDGDGELAAAETEETNPESLFEQARAVSEAEEPEQPQCNVRVCERFYRSFRASDCTFQPYGGGPRKLCTR